MVLFALGFGVPRSFCYWKFFPASLFCNYFFPVIKRLFGDFTWKKNLYGDLTSLFFNLFKSICFQFFTPNLLFYMGLTKDFKIPEKSGFQRLLSTLPLSSECSIYEKLCTNDASSMMCSCSLQSKLLKKKTHKQTHFLRIKNIKRSKNKFPSFFVHIKIILKLWFDSNENNVYAKPI